MIDRPQSPFPERRELLVVNDADRMLLNTPYVTRALLEAASRVLEVETAETSALIDLRREKGQTTQIHDIFSDFGKTKLDDLYRTFVLDADPTKICYPDVPDYLEFLDASPDIEHMILTYGPEQQQEAKLAAAGLSTRAYRITDTPEKAPVIAAWKLETARRVRPVVSSTSPSLDIEALNVVLADDKERAFSGKGSDIGGFVVKRTTEYPNIVPGLVKLPEGTVLVHGLEEIMQWLRLPAQLDRQPMTQVFWKQATHPTS